MNVKPHLIRFFRLGLLSLYVMVTGCNDGTRSAPVSREATLNVALLGVCFEAQPSGINGMTDVAGRYRYSVGDSVRFWVPASGNECRATQTQGSQTSGFALGLISPRGMLDGSVLATFLPRFATGRQIVQMSQALNPEATGSSQAGSKSAPSASSLISNGTPASQPPLLTPVTPMTLPQAREAGSYGAAAASGSTNTTYGSVNSGTVGGAPDGLIGNGYHGEKEPNAGGYRSNSKRPTP